MAPRLYYCDHHEFPLPAGHRFPVRKYGLVRDLLDGAFRFEPAPPADARAIALAHDADYVEAFLNGTVDAAIMRRIGFPWSAGLVRRTLASVGGTLAACDDALATGFGGSLAGGTHHACRSSGAGFCVFNDLAIAILSLRAQGRVRRAAVLDLDVHQGDGTAEIFADDRETLTISVHGENNFPFRKRESAVDIALADGTGDAAYLDALARLLPRVVEFEPGLVLYQSGVDGLASDRLGRLALTLGGLRERDRMVFETCRARAIPVVTTLGGGYSEPIELTAEAHAATFYTAARIFRFWAFPQGVVPVYNR